MNNHDEPLSQEERVLAERVARLGPHGEPSPALDARILAAAHAAASAPALTRRSTRRWPVALGIAASLTLAVGIAWQLRPLQETATYEEAASATAAQAEMTMSSAESAADTVALEEQADAASQPDAGTGVARPPALESRRPPAKVRPAPRAFIPAAEPSLPQEAPEVLDQAAAPTAAAVPDPSPAVSGIQAPPPAAPVAKATSAESRNHAAQRNSVDAAAGAAAASRQEAFAEDAGDVPPATADSPEVRDAWMQRIRELAKAGNTDDARASLREFVRRYPDHPLPDDLRTLLQ